MSASIIYQLPTIEAKKYNYYEFPKIEEAIYQEKSISKYEIPQYIQEIPEGFSIFCTLWEASKVKQYLQLSKEEQERLGVIEKEEQNKDEDLLKEPIPRSNFCHLCRRKFDDYLVHIETMMHKNNICKNPMMINTVQDTFKRINNFWNNKNNNLNNEINEKEKGEKGENLKLYGRSISSFSSAVSIFKCEDNIMKDINSFILEPENSDTEKINDKENQNENKNKKLNKNKNKKYRHVKNKSYFITPKKNEKLLEHKDSNQLSSSQSSMNLFINKKRKGNNNLESGKNASFIEEERNEKQNDYFTKLNADKNKKLIRGVNVYFK